jgi:hypothetical protein
VFLQILTANIDFGKVCLRNHILCHVGHAQRQENGLILVRIEAYKLVEHWLINHLWRKLTRKTCVDISWFWKKGTPFLVECLDYPHTCGGEEIWPRRSFWRHRRPTQLPSVSDWAGLCLPCSASTSTSLSLSPTPFLVRVQANDSVAGPTSQRHRKGALPPLDFLEMGASGEVA